MAAVTEVACGVTPDRTGEQSAEGWDRANGLSPLRSAIALHLSEVFCFNSGARSAA